MLIARYSGLASGSRRPSRRNLPVAGFIARALRYPALAVPRHFVIHDPVTIIHVLILTSACLTPLDEASMAPTRRYLRISKYSVLECRIYLDNPSLVQSWLLNPRNPVLPRVIESVRPLVLPKLREERERSKKKGAKKKAIKDIVVQGMPRPVHDIRGQDVADQRGLIADDFEVSIFLTETDTRHSLLKKHKHFRDKVPPRLQSNTNKLMGETSDNPLNLDLDGNVTIAREESDDEDGTLLANIPTAPEARPTRQKRHRPAPTDDDYDEFQSSDDEYEQLPIELDSDTEEPPSKRPRESAEPIDQDGDTDDKKKLAMDVSYEGFAIYGRVLCLVVRRKDNPANVSRANAASSSVKPSGQANMDNWITSTQIPVGEDIR